MFKKLFEEIMGILKDLLEIKQLLLDGKDNALIEDAIERLDKLIQKVKDWITI
ncbi:MAG: hypothetical protein PHS93_10255 [Candidatus Omnitrophica bacterium]|jgi:hypothetical protein|nr:hypothetical protein [Candidatus Omnitrophota bacterium]